MTGTLLDIEDVRYGLLGAYINIMVALQIRGLREKRGWSQEELARRAGLHQEQISLLESLRWKHDPTVEILQKISRALNVALKIRFEDWGSLVTEFCGSSAVPIPLSFDEDPAFHDTSQTGTAEVSK